MPRFDEEPGVDHESAQVVGRRITRRLVQSLGSRIERIILFGSRARGDAKPGSDYDLLVILDDPDEQGRREAYGVLYRAVETADAVAEIHIMSAEEFEETKTVIGGLAHPASTEGMLLYERPSPGAESGAAPTTGTTT